MTSFEKICTLLASLEHDLRTPIGILKGDLSALKSRGESVDRMERQIVRILNIIPPVDRIVKEMNNGQIVEDITQGSDGKSWFIEQVQLLGLLALKATNMRISLNSTELRIAFESFGTDGSFDVIAGQSFKSFWELFVVLYSNSPPYGPILLLDSIIEHLGWTLSLTVVK